MHTRTDYLEHRCTHREYYAQFVNQGVRDLVLRRFTRTRLLKSTGEHFNDIPLQEWDNLAPFVYSALNRHMPELGDTVTLSGAVCTLKEAAQQIVEEAIAKPAPDIADRPQPHP